MEKQRGMAFGLRKMATVVKKTGQIDYYYYFIIIICCYFYNWPPEYQSWSVRKQIDGA